MARWLVLVAIVGGSASGAPLTVTGQVTDAHSHWTDDGSRIVTEATVRTASGDVVVSELGGTVDGLTMQTFPGPALLHAGMLVDVAAHDDVDLQLAPHVVVDDVRVNFDPVRDPPGFVRSGPTHSGHYLYWESGCIFVTPDSAGTAEIAGSGEFPIIDAAVATWNNDTHTGSCSYIQVKEDQPRSVEVGKDEVNVIKFRDTGCSQCPGNGWCRPAIASDPARCYNGAAAGITTATYIDDATSSRDGAIVDADIEINGVNFAISINGQTLGTAQCHAELQNTLTHELGHLHGLEHTCLSAGDPARVDNTGASVPFCTMTNDPTILDSVMYPYQACGETKKEVLSADDINGICTIYPVANDPHTCARVTIAGGCCSADGDPTGAFALAGVVGVVLARGRRRRAIGARREPRSTL